MPYKSPKQKPPLRRRKNETTTAFRNRKARAKGFKDYYAERIALGMRKGKTRQESRGKAGPNSKEKPVTKPRARAIAEPQRIKTKGGYKRVVYDFSGYRSATRRRLDFIRLVVPALKRRGDDGQIFIVYEGYNVDSPGHTFGLWQKGWTFGDEALYLFDLIEKDWDGRILTAHVASVPR